MVNSHQYQDLKYPKILDYLDQDSKLSLNKMGWFFEVKLS